MTECTYVGLDVHLESITAAILVDDARHAEVVRLSGDVMQVRRLFRRLAKNGPIRSCYEASGAGFVLHRLLARDGLHCDVIAPSLIPRNTATGSISYATNSRDRFRSAPGPRTGPPRTNASPNDPAAGGR
jgi:hypothetical protein